MSGENFSCSGPKLGAVGLLCTLSGGKSATKRETNGHMTKKIWFRRLGLLLAVIGGASLLPGCRTNSQSDDVQVRLINAVPDSGGLTVSVDGQRVWKNAQFGSSTGYQGISAGTYQVSLDSQSLGTLPSARPAMTFEKGKRYTVLALGRGLTATAQVWEDSAPNTLPMGKVEMRLIQAVPNEGPVDLVINNIVGLKSVGYGRRSQTLLLDRGSYDLKVVAADTPDLLAGPISLRLDAGHVYTLVTQGQSDSSAMSLAAYSDVP